MDPVREHLIDQLTAEYAHLSFADSVDGLEPASVGTRPDSLPYSIWELVEHIRIAQEDIVQFCVNPGYRAPKWPDDYWPDEQAPTSDEAWKAALNAIESDRQKMVGLVKDPQNNLFESIPHGDGQTLFREAILIIDHTSYHTGQIMTARRILNLW